MSDKNSWPCWSCKTPVTMTQRADADGNCPHCGAELDIESWPFPSGVAAPVVERQQPDDPLSKGFYTTQSGGGNYAINIGFRSLAEMQSADRQMLDLLRSRNAPPELAELQATIARLSADKETMRNKNNELNDTVAKQSAEIERLKGGQGEPTLWFKHLIGAECKSNGQTYDVMFCAMPGYTPLYTSQPAPVAVMLPERMQRTAGLTPLVESHIDGWNSCLDKVKELNQ